MEPPVASRSVAIRVAVFRSNSGSVLLSACRISRDCTCETEIDSTLGLRKVKAKNARNTFFIWPPLDSGYGLVKAEAGSLHFAQDSSNGLGPWRACSSRSRARDHGGL